MLDWYWVALLCFVAFAFGVGLSFLFLAMDRSVTLLKSDEIIIKKSEALKLQKALRLVMTRIDPEFLANENSPD